MPNPYQGQYGGGPEYEGSGTDSLLQIGLPLALMGGAGAGGLLLKGLKGGAKAVTGSKTVDTLGKSVRRLTGQKPKANAGTPKAKPGARSAARSAARAEEQALQKALADDTARSEATRMVKRPAEFAKQVSKDPEAFAVNQALARDAAKAAPAQTTVGPSPLAQAPQGGVLKAPAAQPPAAPAQPLEAGSGLIPKRQVTPPPQPNAGPAFAETGVLPAFDRTGLLHPSALPSQAAPVSLTPAATKVAPAPAAAVGTRALPSQEPTAIRAATRAEPVQPLTSSDMVPTQSGQLPTGAGTARPPQPPAQAAAAPEIPAGPGPNTETLRRIELAKAQAAGTAAKRPAGPGAWGGAPKIPTEMREASNQYMQNIRAARPGAGVRGPDLGAPIERPGLLVDRPAGPGDARLYQPTKPNLRAIAKRLQSSDGYGSAVPGGAPAVKPSASLVAPSAKPPAQAAQVRMPNARPAGTPGQPAVQARAEKSGLLPKQPQEIAQAPNPAPAAARSAQPPQQSPQAPAAVPQQQAQAPAAAPTPRAQPPAPQAGTQQPKPQAPQIQQQQPQPKFQNVQQQGGVASVGQAPMAPKAAPNQNTASLQSTNTGVHAPNTVQAGAPNLNPNSLNKTSEVREFLKKLAMSMNPVMSATKMNVKSSLPGVKMPGAATPKIKMPSVSQKSAPNTMNVGPPAMGAQAGMQTPALPQPGVTAGAPTMGSNINPTPNPAQTSQMTGSGPGANKMASLGRVLSGEMYLKPPKKKKGVGIPVPKATGTGSSLKKLSAWSKRAAYYGNGFGVVNPTDTTIQSEPVPKELQMDPNPNPLTAPTEHEYKKYRSRAVPPKRDSTFPHPGVARPQSALWSNNMMHGVFLEEPRVENPGAMDTMMGPGNQPYSTDMADTSMMAPEEQFMEGSPGTNEGGAGPLQTA